MLKIKQHRNIFIEFTFSSLFFKHLNLKPVNSRKLLHSGNFKMSKRSSHVILKEQLKLYIGNTEKRIENTGNSV